MTTEPKIQGAVIPRRVFTQPGVNSTHYRSATFMAASPQLTDIRMIEFTCVDGGRVSWPLCDDRTCCVYRERAADPLHCSRIDTKTSAIFRTPSVHPGTFRASRMWPAEALALIPRPRKASKPTADIPLHWLWSESCHVWTAPAVRGCARMRRYDELFNNLGPLSPRPFYLDCIIAMRGCDFREGQSFRRRLLF
jgi:hypothetical protein